MKGIFGKKIGMTRVFTPEGECVPVTVIEASPSVVVQVKTVENDGYSAIQLGLGTQKSQRLTRAVSGHVAKAKKGTPRQLAEVRLDSGKVNVAKDAEYAVGDEISLEGMFEAGDLVDVAGTTIGKGYAGVIKRHGMKGAQTMTHGTHEYFRHGGSIGCRKFPGRVFKNKKMAGHMGHVRRTQEKLKVVQVRPEENLLLIRGSVPGPRNGDVFVRAAVKQKARVGA